MLFKNLRSRGFTVRAVDKFGHDPQYPVTDNWPHLVQQLHDFAEREVEQARRAGLPGRPFAGRLPEPDVRGAPSAARARRAAARLAAAGRLEGHGAGRDEAHAAGGLGLAGARQPPAQEPLAHAAKPRFEHFRHKKAFAHWDEQVLHDYITHCTHDEDGERVLSFDRDIETAIYNTLPDNLDRLLRRHPLKCPVALHRRARLARR